MAAHLKNWEFRVLTRDGYEGYTAALREQSLETRDITTQVCPVHARRRICNAVNVDHFADITTQDNGAELAASRFEEHSPQYLLYMALTALRKLYGWEETKNRQKGESREQQLERILRFRREHCAALMDSVDEIMMALAEKYAVERNGRWYLAREGSAIGKAVIFWLNNRKELRSFLHDPRICPDNNQVERSVRAVALYRNAAFFKKSIEGTKGFCNLLTLRETAKLNGIKDVPKWLNAVHRAFYQHVEPAFGRHATRDSKTASRCAFVSRPSRQSLLPPLTGGRGCRGTTPARCHRQSAARRSETLTSQHALGTPAQAGALLRAAPKVCNCFNEINENNALGFLRVIVRINGNFH